MDDLFDLDVETISVSGGDSMSRQVAAGWRAWCDLTQRPDASSIDRRFATVYRAQLLRHRPQAELLRLVRAAARVAVAGRDGRDVSRVTAALSQPRRAAFALAALFDDEPLVLFPRSDPTTDVGRYARLAAVLGTPRRLWTGREQEAAAMLLERLDNAALAAAVDEVALMLGTDVLMPSEVLARLSSTRRGKVARKDTRTTFAGGRAEDDALAGAELALDREAERRLFAGASPTAVGAYHRAVPKGYWQDVLALVESGESIVVAFDVLSTEHDGFHPSQRAWSAS